MTASGDHQSLQYIYEFLCVFFYSTCKGTYMVVFLWFVSVSILPLSIHVVTNGKISFFYGWIIHLHLFHCVSTHIPTQHVCVGVCVCVCVCVCRLHSVCRLPWWLSGKASACQGRRCKRHGFDLWVRMISWRRKWQTHTSILAWEIPQTEVPSRLQLDTI